MIPHSTFVWQSGSGRYRAAIEEEKKLLLRDVLIMENFHVKQYGSKKWRMISRPTVPWSMLSLTSSDEHFDCFNKNTNNPIGLSLISQASS